MKHTPSPISSSGYYYRAWKHHCFLFLLAAAGVTNGVIWAAVAGFYGSAPWVIACSFIAAFSVFAGVIEYRQCERYHTLYLRALCSGPSIFNT